MSSNDRTQYPSHLQPVPDSGSLGGAGAAGAGGQGTPGLTPPLPPRPLARLHHRRPGRARLRLRRSWSQAAIEAARTAGRTPEALLLEQGAINDDQLSRATAERYGLDHVDLAVYNVDVAAAALFPVTMARRYMAVPVGYVDQHTLLVAAADPANVLAVDDIQIATGLDCQIAVAAKADVEALLGAARHAAERRRRGDHRPRRTRRKTRPSSPRSATCRPAPRTRR